MPFKAVPTIQIDNSRTRVTEWRFPPGASTGWHRHEMDYVVTPMTNGQLKLIDNEGTETIADLQCGQSYFRNTGVEHDVVNINKFEFIFVETEFK
jgi:quercetin dioxygenase-like cupin family protein